MANQNTFNSYPHPVLGNSEDIVNNSLIIQSQIREHNKNYEFNISINESEIDEEFVELINNDKISISYMVNCSDTLFRRTFVFNKLNEVISIPMNDISGRVEITCYLIAKKNLKEISFINQNDIFDDETFNIEKGEWIGISNTLVQFIEPPHKKNLPENKKSIFSFFKDKTLKGVFDVPDWSLPIIRIHIPIKDYENALNVLPYNFKKTFYYTIIVTILAKAIDIISDEDSESEYNEFKWYTVIEEKLKDNEISKIYNHERKINKNWFVVAQYILEQQFSNMINELIDATEVIEDIT